MNWKTFLATYAALLILDFIWLGFVVQKFYVSQLRGIARIQGDRFEVHYWAAALVYVLLTIGICYFVLPKVSAGSWVSTWMIGALFGLICYGVYDLTNHAIMTWPTPFMAADIAWGAMVCGLSTLVARYVDAL